ncbi:MAG: restriction endonuclease [Lachnospiraceae bacterium]|nr:restriction endonuclease [Lachnospiraceae bacterium]
MHNLPIPKKQPNSEHQTEPLQISANFDIMEGHDFEYFCADILRKNGFTNVQVTQGSGDYGIDILAKKDDIKYAIQCKCYSGNIGNGAVQEAHSGKDIYNCDVGVVMTNRYFTKSAIETAQAHKIKLWDRDKLLEFIRNAEQTK